MQRGLDLIIVFRRLEVILVAYRQSVFPDSYDMFGFFSGTDLWTICGYLWNHDLGASLFCPCLTQAML